jgi:hypothetical protein
MENEGIKEEGVMNDNGYMAKVTDSVNIVVDGGSGPTAGEEMMIQLPLSLPILA